MRRILLLLVVFLCFAAARAEETHIPRIAVLDLTSRDVPESELLMLTERLRVSLFNTGQFQIVEREKVEIILREQDFQMSPCAATECAVEVGRLIGADKMVAGSVGRVGSQYSIILRLINVETGAIERTAVKDCRCPIEDVMTRTIGEAAGELAGAVRQAPSRESEPANQTGATERPPQTAPVSTAPVTRVSSAPPRSRSLLAVEASLSGSYVRRLGIVPTIGVRPSLLVGSVATIGVGAEIGAVVGLGEKNPGKRRIFSVGLPLAIRIARNTWADFGVALQPMYARGPYRNDTDMGYNRWETSGVVGFKAGCWWSISDHARIQVEYVGINGKQYDYDDITWFNGLGVGVIYRLTK